MPTSPAWTIVGNNLGAFRVIQSQNKCSDPKPALVRAIPFRELLEVGTREGTALFLFANDNNKTDARVFRFSVKQ